jgi:hypothetical protein
MDNLSKLNFNLYDIMGRDADRGGTMLPFPIRLRALVFIVLSTGSTILVR